jgi:hypothetical protein
MYSTVSDDDCFDHGFSYDRFVKQLLRFLFAWLAFQVNLFRTTTFCFVGILSNIRKHICYNVTAIARNLEIRCIKIGQLITGMI